MGLGRFANLQDCDIFIENIFSLNTKRLARFPRTVDAVAQVERRPGNMKNGTKARWRQVGPGRIFVYAIPARHLAT